MKRSRRGLSINMVISRFVFKSNQITLSLSVLPSCVYFEYCPKGTKYPDKGLETHIGIFCMSVP